MPERKRFFFIDVFPYLLDLIVALAKELFASSEQHLLVLTLDFHLSTKVKRLKATKHDDHLGDAGDRDGDPLPGVDVDRSHLEGHRVQRKPAKHCLADGSHNDAFLADADHLCLYWIYRLLKALTSVYIGFPAKQRQFLREPGEASDGNSLDRDFGQNVIFGKKSDTILI